MSKKNTKTKSKSPNKRKKEEDEDDFVDEDEDEEVKLVTKKKSGFAVPSKKFLILLLRIDSMSIRVQVQK